MKLIHIHIHPNFNWVPHFIIQGYDSLDEEIEAGRIRKHYNKKNKEYLIFTGCKTCEHKRWASWLIE